MTINIFEGARRIAKLVALIGVVIYFVVIFMSSPYVPIWYAIRWPDKAPALVTNFKCKDSVTEYRSDVSTKSGKSISLTMCFEKQVASDGRKLIFYNTVTPSTPTTSRKKLATVEAAFLAADRAGDTAAAAVLAQEVRRLRGLAPEALSTDPNAGIPFDPDKYLAGNAPRYLSTDPNAGDRYWGNESYSPEVTEYTKRTINAFVIPPGDEDWIERQWWSKRWAEARQATYVLFGGLAFLWGLSWAIGWIVRGFAGIPTGSDKRPEA